VFVAIPVCGESKNPADYPLRVQILTTSEVTFYHNRYPDESKGDGRANLFENGEPRGVDFSFDCTQKIKPSFGFETYPAKWKKKDGELIVLFPVFGRSNAFFTCTLKTRLKDYAYVSRNGRLDSEPPATIKAWMASHDYDPEHGKDTPTSGGTMLAPTRLDMARQFLTGNHKDTAQAARLLLAIVQSGKIETTPEELAWAQIYLGYIEDRAKNRQKAISWYERALAVEGAPSGGLGVAKYGLRQPLVWIRHLDAEPNQR
jgi:hypothetical protein